MPKLPPAETPPTPPLPEFVSLAFTKNDIHTLLTALGAAVAAVLAEDSEDRAALRALIYMLAGAQASIHAVGVDETMKLINKLHTAHIAICPTAAAEITTTKRNLQ